ncbi:MAG: SurA N-terminal domain-containing protein [Ferruginibacter sp.]|nr:SurA N-terminal domain-containing protein [Cytophagales bacterium]
MALINEIRERSGIVIGIIAISLILFIVGGDIFGSGKLFGGDSNKVGEIAGHDVMYDEFNQDVERIKASAGQPIPEEQMSFVREQAWNQYLLRYGYQKQYDALGLTVSDDEVVDMVQGNSIAPAVKQIPIFKNEQTGEFDKNLVKGFLGNLKGAPVENQAQWKQFEDGLRSERQRTKYENLLSLSSYVTTAEAQREYEAQTAKATVKYAYIPFFSVPDSTVKVTDAQLEAYLNKNPAKYKGVDTRSLQYVTFAVLPSKKDSADFLQELKELAQGLASAENDTAYAQANSDVPSEAGYVDISKMSDPLKATLGTFFKGGVYGPYQEGDTYAIYKLLNSKQDTVSSLRASHILITAPKEANDSTRTAARRKAQGLLDQLKAGANFEELARTNGSDGTASRGGDLGWYTQGGGFVKPFEDALLAAPGKGLMPNLVETEFGYHVVQITEPKTNQKYQFATIKKTIGPSEETQNEAFEKAERFASQSQTAAAFKESLKKDPSLVPFTAERVRQDASNLNSLTNAREVIRWAFNEDTKANGVSPVFDVDNQYVVALLTGRTDADDVTVADYRDELTGQVRNEIKAEQILKKLGTVSGKLEDVAKKYGPEAVVESAPDVTLSSASLKNVGFDPVAAGKVFGLKKGGRTKPFAGESGVLIVELQNLAPAPEIADYSQYKNQLKQTNTQRTSYLLNEAIKDNANIKDNRAKFY